MIDNIKKELEDYICRIDKAIKVNTANNEHLTRLKKDMQKLLNKLNEDAILNNNFHEKKLW